MPKAKPVSLDPLTFHEAVNALVKVKPAGKKKKGAKKTAKNR